MQANAPSRSTATLSIQAGLLSIPVKLYTATEEVKVRRSQYLADGTKVGSAPCVLNEDGSYGDKVDRADIVKRYETDHGLVDLSDDEVEQIIAGATGVADILAIHPYDVYDSGDYLPSGGVWQVRPDKTGVKPFSLILAALDRRESFALLRWVRSGTVYIGALFPNGRLYGIRFADEVRAERDLPVAELSEAEIALACELVDTYREDKALDINHPHAKVREYAEAKAAGQSPTPVARAKQPTPLDLVNALAASVKTRREKVSA